MLEVFVFVHLFVWHIVFVFKELRRGRWGPFFFLSGGHFFLRVGKRHVVFVSTELRLGCWGLCFVRDVFSFQTASSDRSIIENRFCCVLVK